MPKIIIDTERCKGCNLCIAVCPRHLIKTSGQLNRKGYYAVKVEKMEECLACQQCALICPEAAIEILKDE